MERRGKIRRLAILAAFTPGTVICCLAGRPAPFSLKCMQAIRHQTSRASKFAKRGRKPHFEALESRQLLATVPYGATSTDLGEYMLGDVNVTVVLLESNGQQDASTENWTPAAINQTKARVTTGLNWWVDTLHAYHPDAYLNFHVDFTFADTPFATKYEPINNTSNTHTQYVQEFLAQQGPYTSIAAFNSAQRVARNANWSFTLFVVNDTNDLDHSFAAGGNFSRSFAYAGGLYLVTLASRPAEIIAHETGHIFWADDEYTGGDSYYDTRGYYNQQNTNGATSAPSGFVQQNSIMSSGSLLTSSYNSHSLPASTRAMIGWRDTDADGLIDVLDVPFTLTGDGFRTAQGSYRFVGKSQVQTLLNQNPAGAQNDITINRIRLAEYRLDGGSWQTAATYDTYAAELDLSIPLPTGDHTIEIRTRDTTTGVTSAIFTASTAQRASVPTPGISGFAFNDANSNGVWDANEGALAGRTVQLVTPTGQPIAGPAVVNPDNYAVGANISYLNPAFDLTAVGSVAKFETVSARDGSYGATSSRMFGNTRSNGAGSLFTTQWYSDIKLRIDFYSPTSMLSIDAIGAADNSYGRLEIYNSSGQLIGRYTTKQLALGGSERMLLARNSSDISYALVYGHASTKIALDNLSVGPEAIATTNALGAYSFSSLATGTYYVKAVTPANWGATNPSTGIRSVSFVSGQVNANVLFGQHASIAFWQNQQNRLDVDGDTFITPVDALLVIIDLNALGGRVLTDPPASGESPPNMIDVDGDGSVGPIDALEVIIYLNSHGAGEATQVVSGGGAGASASGGNDVAPQGEEPVYGWGWESSETSSEVDRLQVRDAALLELFSSEQVTSQPALDTWAGVPFSPMNWLGSRDASLAAPAPLQLLAPSNIDLPTWQGTAGRRRFHATRQN